MVMNRNIRKSQSGWDVILVGLLFCSASNTAWAAETITDHRVEVKIDERVSIVPPSDEGRAMLGMVRHPDGTIFLNTQRQGLYKSVDEGRTWTPSPVTLTKHKIDGLGVSSDGKLWLLHQYHTTELYVSNSADVGLTWTTVPVLFQDMAPGGSQRPYWTAEQDYNSFVEGPDGSMMTAVELRYSNEKTADYQAEDQSAPGMHSTMIRTTDGGKTWGDPTSVHQYVAETSLAADPNDADHILAFTRIQRGAIRGENVAMAAEATGIPKTSLEKGHAATMLYKNGILLESTDGGLSFSEIKGGMIGFYAMRGTIVWAKNNVIVATHQDGFDKGEMTGQLFARISLDGGITWVSGSKNGSPFFNQSKSFELVPAPPGHSFMAPTVELSPNHFLTAYAHLDPKTRHLEARLHKLTISGVFWHLEPASGNKSAR